jgi:hypothetical protein
MSYQYLASFDQLLTAWVAFQEFAIFEGIA